MQHHHQAEAARSGAASSQKAGQVTAPPRKQRHRHLTPVHSAISAAQHHRQVPYHHHSAHVGRAIPARLHRSPLTFISSASRYCCGGVWWAVPSGGGSPTGLLGSPTAASAFGDGGSARLGRRSLPPTISLYMGHPYAERRLGESWSYQRGLRWSHDMPAVEGYGMPVRLRWATSKPPTWCLSSPELPVRQSARSSPMVMVDAATICMHRQPHPITTGPFRPLRGCGDEVDRCAPAPPRSTQTTWSARGTTTIPIIFHS